MSLGDVIPGSRKFELTLGLVKTGGEWKVRAVDGDGTAAGWE